MKLRGLVIAALVLCALAGALYWSGRNKPKESATPPANSSPAILKIDMPAITGFTLKKKNAEPITLEETAAGKWQITAPGKYNADQDAVSGVLSTLSSLYSQRVIEDKAVNLRQYGLKEPDLEVDVTEKDRKTQSVEFGDKAPTGDAVYTMAGDNPKVFTAASFNESSVDKSLNDLRDKRLLPMNTDKVSRMELIRGHQDIVFGRSKNGWEILKPRPLRTDGSTVDALVNQLAEARMDLSGSAGAGVDKAFAHSAPVAVAKLTGDMGTQMLQVRKSKDTYYAESSAVKGDYKVDSSLGEAVSKNLDEFRNKALFDFSFQQPNKIELHNETKTGSKDWLFTWDGKNWSSDGKKMDVDSMDSLVSDLRELKASKFVDSGFGKPEIVITVTSQNGKDVEKVLIAKSGENYIAKREDEPSLYALNAGDVSGLLKVAEGVKPATPAAK